LELPLPPLPEQRRIVATLDEAFTALDAMRANAEKNLQNARELFDGYLNSVFTQKKEGWAAKKLGELGKITSSKRIFKNEYTKSGIPFYRTKEIKERANGRDVTLELFISPNKYHEIRKKFGAPTAGDILITAIGTIGEVYVVEPKDTFYFKDGNVLWLYGFNGLDPYFLKFALKAFVKTLQNLSHGSAYNALPIEKLKEYILSAPSEEEQKYIVTNLTTLQIETQRLEDLYEEKLSSLAELKQFRATDFCGEHRRMNEAETRAELIDPALKAAGWGVVDASRIRREVIAPGRLEGAGRRAKPEIADYVLVYRNTKLAVIEAKRRDLADTEGVGQAKNYAGKLQSRFAFSTNGAGIYQIDMQTGAEAYVSAWPSPQELWSLAFAKESAWRDRFAAVPFVEKGSDWTLRYYQANAVNKTLERLAEGGNRVLLTLATGTGKTSIAFEIAWKLFEAKWNLSGEPTRRPRILFLADRNNLANQIATTLDDYVYTSDDEIIEGEVQEGRRYTEAEFNRIIEIKERERYRVKLFMDMINQREKTLVFCATQAHALAVRDLVNQMKTSADPHYCERVTADDGKIGDQHLEAFRNNEKTIPTILTSSQKLSTGVDARKGRIATHYDDKLQAFLDFVLAQYVSQGVEELDQEKLGALIALKYGSTHEAAATLGGVPVIRDTFVGFQRYLYET
jgi:hypothetical protein